MNQFKYKSPDFIQAVIQDSIAAMNDCTRKGFRHASPQFQAAAALYRDAVDAKKAQQKARTQLHAQRKQCKASAARKARKVSTK